MHILIDYDGIPNSPSQVIDHLAQHGLITKQPEMIENAKALGLQITKNKIGQLLWSRGNALPDVLGPVTRRELFSICGVLTGHWRNCGRRRVLKGVNMALKWCVSGINIKTDSATVYKWLNFLLYNTHTIKAKGMNEMLVKRRLGVLRELCTEYKLELSIQWVCSEKNKADYLTRVPKR